MSSGGLVSCTSQVVLSGTGHHAFAIEARLHQGAQAGKDKGVRRLDDPVSLWEALQIASSVAEVSLRPNHRSLASLAPGSPIRVPSP